MPTITVLASHTSSRLLYTLDWLLKEQLQLNYTLVFDPKEAPASDFFIVYGFNAMAFENAFFIPDNGLLWEKNISEAWHEKIDQSLKTALKNSAVTSSFSFDLFSVVFFLLSRYEEYFPFTLDKHNRYPATDSILFKNDVLERPVIDEWLQQFRNVLQNNFAVNIVTPAFRFMPSYDIDIAWSYKNKGLARNAGALLRNFSRGNFAETKNQLSVLSGKKTDVYDAYLWMDTLHKNFSLRPLYFILAALETTPFDKNIDPNHPAMQTLIKAFSASGIVGMHPSYFTENNDRLFASEKSTLANVSGKPVYISRQHYIKFRFPQTCHQLIENSITDDFSMGYGTHLGFRAGTSCSFLWYDLQNEQATTLKIHPFCFMDTTAHYEQQLSAATAFERLQKMADQIKASNGQLITIFHNFSLGTAAEWSGWREAYRTFVSSVIS